MLFAFLCTDKPGSLDLRLKIRPDHVAFLNGLGDAMKLAGPFTDDAGSPNGSLVVIEAQDRKAAEAIAAKDPYAIAGLFASIEIKPWKWTLKNPEAK
jgi:uncharacterized protein